MEAVRLGALDCVLVPSRGPTRRLLVLMHGFGAPGDDLVGLASELGDLDDTTVVFPAAPHTFVELYGAPPFMDARAWWKLDLEAIERARRSGGLRDLTRERPAGLDAARALVVELLTALRARYPETAGSPPLPIVLGGFSQGAMLATDAALREPGLVSALVVLSGSLLCESEWTPLFPGLAPARVFQSHGTEDDILPYAYAERLREGLTAAGVNVQFTRFTGGHGIPPAVLRDLSAFLAA